MATEEYGLAASGIEPVISEEEDLASSPAGYEIVTYPADFTLEGLVAKYNKGQLKIPGFQRKYVWTQTQASKLVESFLLGLPVPAIFLHANPKTGVLEVIDGQQRLLSIVYYFEGYFGPPEKGKRAIFGLVGLNEKSPYANRTYRDLERKDQAAFNKLNDSVLRAFVIKQLNPTDSSSIYHIFERLNTGGTQLASQEIRNCIFHGSFNDRLRSINEIPCWRDIFGNASPDKHLRDIELVLRFLALKYAFARYQKPMKDFLSSFMETHCEDAPESLAEFETAFNEAAAAVLASLGPKPFHIKAGLNAAVYDSVMVGYSNHLNKVPGDIKDRWKRLVRDPEFLEAVSSGTTDVETIKKRFQRVEQVLFC